MFLRLTLALLVLAGSGWWLERAQRQGRFQAVDEAVQDGLTGVLRRWLESNPPGGSGAVVWVQLREDERKEYAAWPPPPLDWQTLLTALQAYEPSVVVIPSPLNWGQPSPDFVPAVAEALRAFPSVVLGVETELAAAGEERPAFTGQLGETLPRFQEVRGPVRSAPALAALVRAPERSLRSPSELGLLAGRYTAGLWRLPYALREGDSLTPTLLAQVLARQTRSPYRAGHRLKLGPGAAAWLQDGRCVLLDADGALQVRDGPPVPTVNALHLMAGSLADLASPEDKAALGRGKIVVIGPAPISETEAAPPWARLHAQALDQILAAPRLRLLASRGQWAVWAVTGLAGLALVTRVRRRRALLAGVGLTALAAGLGFLAFLGWQIWFPPTLPVAWIGLSTLLGLLLGRPSPASAEAVTPAPAAAAPAAKPETSQETTAKPDAAESVPAPGDFGPELPAPTAAASPPAATALNPATTPSPAAGDAATGPADTAPKPPIGDPGPAEAGLPAPAAATAAAQDAPEPPPSDTPAPAA